MGNMFMFVSSIILVIVKESKVVCSKSSVFKMAKFVPTSKSNISMYVQCVVQTFLVKR